jgi:hypothetical protein
VGRQKPALGEHIGKAWEEGAGKVTHDMEQRTQCMGLFGARRVECVYERDLL